MGSSSWHPGPWWEARLGAQLSPWWARSKLSPSPTRSPRAPSPCRLPAAPWGCSCPAAPARGEERRRLAGCPGRDEGSGSVRLPRREQRILLLRGFADGERRAAGGEPAASPGRCAAAARPGAS